MWFKTIEVVQFGGVSGTAFAVLDWGGLVETLVCAPKRQVLDDKQVVGDVAIDLKQPERDQILVKAQRTEV